MKQKYCVEARCTDGTIIQVIFGPEDIRANRRDQPLKQPKDPLSRLFIVEVPE